MMSTPVRMCKLCLRFELLYLQKYDILTEYLTLLWFAMLVNEYKLYVSIQESSKDATFGQCLYLGSPLFSMSRIDAPNGVEIIFKHSSFKTTRIFTFYCFIIA